MRIDAYNDGKRREQRWRGNDEDDEMQTNAADRTRARGVIPAGAHVPPGSRARQGEVRAEAQAATRRAAGGWT